MKRKLNMFKSEDDTLNVLRSNGKNKHPEDVNILEIFYSEYNTIPYIFQFDAGVYYNWETLVNNLKTNYDIEVLFQEESKSLKDDIRYYKQQTLRLREGLILQLEGTLLNESSIIDSIKNFTNNNMVIYSIFLVDGEISKEEELILSKIFENSKEEEENKVNIGMVSMDNGSYYIKEFDIKDGVVELELFDLHYGEGFEDFYNQLLNRLLTKNKGLTLFHGDPGTGKTTLLRYLIKDIMRSSKKNNVIYFPPTMVDSITDPSFINFISDWVGDNGGKTYLLIEDAEPLLESRDHSRNLGITNLLNLTDGILNDILNIQIISTFNTKLENLDPALLRPERLLGRKEFKKLPLSNSIKLAEYLEIDTELIKGKMSLADIYSLKKESKPLTHDIDEVKGRIGF